MNKDEKFDSIKETVKWLHSEEGKRRINEALQKSDEATKKLRESWIFKNWKILRKRFQMAQ